MLGPPRWQIVCWIANDNNERRKPETAWLATLVPQVQVILSRADEVEWNSAAISFSDSSSQAARPIITVGPTYRANQKDKEREYERVHAMFLKSSSAHAKGTRRPERLA